MKTLRILIPILLGALVVPIESMVAQGTSTTPQIILPSRLMMLPGETAPFPVMLSSAAPHDGVFISLSSSDPSTATVSPQNIIIPGGYTTPGYSPKVAGVTSGTVTITAAVFGMPSVSARVQVGSGTVLPPAPPTIAVFTAAPSTISPGQAATLSWIVSGADTASIDQGVGTLSTTGSKTVWPTQTATYTLTAGNAGGSAAARITVTVNPPKDTQPPTPPAVVSAVAKSPSEVDLTWTAGTDNVGVTGYRITRNGNVIASVSSPALSYADIGLGAATSYTYTIQSFDAAGNYSVASAPAQATTPSASVGPTVLNRCQPITQSGHYMLGAALQASPNSSCISIHDTRDVYLDCRGNSIVIDRATDSGGDSAIAVSNVASYSIANCSLTALNTNAGGTLPTLSVVNSPQGTITGNTFRGGYISVTGSAGLEISHNSSSTFFNLSGNNQTVEYNTITLDSRQIYGAALTLSSSSGSVVQFNAVNGGWDGVVRQSQLGSDDGILLYDVNNTVIRNNTILNTWDTGIENVRPMMNVQILNNQITTAGTAGIGGWYGNSLTGVTVSGNTVTDTPRLIDYWRADGPYTFNGEQNIYFLNNIFNGNSLVKPRISFQAPGAGRIDFQNLPFGFLAGALVSGNNRIANNDFGPFGTGIRLLPATGFLDGGGNVCSPDSTLMGFSLQCASRTPPGGYYALAASPSAGEVTNPGKLLTVLFGANPGSVGDYIGLAAVGSGGQHFLSIQATGGSTQNALIFAAPTLPGQYEFRYMRSGAALAAAVSNPVTVAAGR